MLVNCMYYYVFFIDWLNKETETETEDENIAKS